MRLGNGNRRSYVDPDDMSTEFDGIFNRVEKAHNQNMRTAKKFMYFMIPVAVGSTAFAVWLIIEFVNFLQRN